MANERTIAKIKLSDGTVGILKDLNALRLSGGTLTGDLTIDAKLTTNKAYILEIEEYIDDTPIPNVLFEDENSHEI